MQISQSKIKTVQTCEQQYVYSYIDGLIPLAPSMPLTRGIWMHTLLEAFDKNEIVKFIESEHGNTATTSLAQELLTDITLNDMRGNVIRTFSPDVSWLTVMQAIKDAFIGLNFSNSDDDINSIFDSIHYLMERYLYWRLTNPPVYTIASEVILEQDGFKGRIDRVVQDVETGKISIMDYKTTKGNIPSHEDRISDLQQNLYCFLWDSLHGKIVKVTHYGWTWLRTADPTAPKFNQDGALSKKSATADLLVWRDTFTEQGLPHSEIPLERVKDDSFFQESVYRYRAAVARKILSQVETAQERIASLHTNPQKALRIMHPIVCQGCSYQPICKLELLGMNTSLEREASFTVDQTRKEIPV